MKYDVRIYDDNGIACWERGVSDVRVFHLLAKGAIIKDNITGFLKIKPL